MKKISVFALAFVKSIFFSRIGFGLLDQGESLHNAQRIIQGNLIYKDFYSIFPPLDNYIFALFQSISGVGILNSRIWQSLIFSISVVLVYSIINKISNKYFALIISLLYVFMDVNVERLFIFTPILLSITLYQNGIALRKIQSIILAGFLLGLVSLIRFDLPATYILGFLVASFLYFKSRTKYYLQELFLSNSLLLIGFLIPICCLLYWLIVHGIFSEFIVSTIINPLVVTKLHSLSFPHVLEILPDSFSLASLSQSYTAFLGWFIVAVVILSLLTLMQHRKYTESKFLQVIFTFSTIFAAPYILGRSDIGHFIKGAIGFICLVPILFTISKSNLIKLLLLAGILVIFIANIVQHITWLNMNDTALEIDGERIIVNSQYRQGSTLPSAETIVAANTFVRKYSSDNEKVLLLPYMAGLYYLTDRMSATEYNNLLAGFIVSEEKQIQFIIDNKDVEVVVYDPQNGPNMDTPLLMQYNPLIHEFIMQNFEVLYKTQEGWLFMLKNK